MIPIFHYAIFISQLNDILLKRSLINSNDYPLNYTKNELIYIWNTFCKYNNYIQESIISKNTLYIYPFIC